MSGQIGIQENEVPRTLKKSRIPVLRSRAPLKGVQSVSVQSPVLRREDRDTPAAHPHKPHSAVRAVPDFELLHRQWAQKLARAKEVKRRQRRIHTPLTPRQRSTHTPHTPRQRSTHTPHRNKAKKSHPQPLQTAMAVRAKAAEESRTERVDAIFARMALSTNNMIRKMSMMDRDRVSPVRADLSEQLTAAEDSPSPHRSQMTLSTPSHNSLLLPITPHTPTGPGGPPNPAMRGTLPHLPPMINFYEYESEMLYIKFTQTCSEIKESGHRNPLSVVLESFDQYTPTQCYFVAINQN